MLSSLFSSWFTGYILLDVFLLEKVQGRNEENGIRCVRREVKAVCVGLNSGVGAGEICCLCHFFFPD